MRIVIDLQGAQTISRFRGIGRYTLSLTQAIVRKRRGHQILLALNGLFPETIQFLQDAFQGILEYDCIKVWYAPGPVRECQSANTWRRRSAELIREAFLSSLQPDLLFIPSVFEGYPDDAVTSIGLLPSRVPSVVTLHDLIPLHNREQYLSPNPQYESFYMKKLEHFLRADAFLAVSHASAKDGEHTLKLSEGRIATVYNACDPFFQKKETDTTGTLSSLGISKAFILYVGEADERKNLPRLIQAFALLPEELRNEYQLVLAGKLPDENIRRLGQTAFASGLNAENCIFTGYVSDEDLLALYSACVLFVFPSWHEGFGLPVLEAMNCGAPVIASNTSSLPEVVGWEEALFNPLDIKDIAAKIEKSLRDSSFRQQLVASGNSRKKLFSWERSADQALDFFERFAVQNHTVRTRHFFVNTLVEAIAAIDEGAPGPVDLIRTASSIASNHPEADERHLFVDISELVQRDAKSGIQRVTRSILKQLLENPPSGFLVEPVYGTLEEEGYRYARGFVHALMGTSKNKDEEDSPISFKHGDFFLGLDLQHQVVHRQQKYLHGLRKAGVHIFFVVYDLLPVLLPSCFPSGADAMHTEWLRTICAFDGVICISASVADEFRLWKEKNIPKTERPFKIEWFHLGADVENSLPSRGMPPDGESILAALSARRTILMVGTVEPRKGYGQTLAAMESLWDSAEELNLVVVGKPGWMTEDLCERIRSHKQAHTKLFWIENASDEFLEKIYARSSCLLAASEGEGFGLPLIEAARHGLPILARDIPVFREVAGNHALYFSGTSAHDLAEGLRRWLRLHETGQHPASEKLPWITWRQSAEHLSERLLVAQSSYTEA